MDKQHEIEALKCADCAASESAVTDLLPSASMPIPAEALTGWPDGRPEERGFSRRSLLKNGVAGLASIYAATRLDWGSVWEEVSAQAAEPMQRSLVCIFLNGGEDSLNHIVPIGPHYDAYKAARPTIWRDGQNGANPVDVPSSAGRVGTKVMPGTGGTLAFPNIVCAGAGTGFTGVDGQGLDVLYGDGSGGAGSDLAIFPGTSYDNATRSHFDGRDIWFRGTKQMTQTGWLGRWLDLYGSQTNPLQAVSVDSSLSKQIRSNTAPVSALANLQGVNFSVPVDNTSIDVTQNIKSLAGVPTGQGNDALGRSRGMFGLTVDVSERLQALSSTAATAGYPNSDLSRKLQLAAILLGSGLGTRIVTIDWGSFDTHGSEVQSQDPQLTTLARALTAFKADLAGRGIEQQVVTMVFSEFGRQVFENDSQGTDHGEGGAVLVSGSAVKGGYAGEFPGIPDKTQRDSLSYKTDFRTIYSAIVGEWLGGDPQAILPDAGKGIFGGIQRFDGGSGLFVPGTLVK